MATVIKLKRSNTSSSVPTTSDLQDGEVALNTADKKIYVRNGGSIVAVANFNELDLSAVDQDIIPDANETRNLGSSAKRFNELFLAGSTINLGGATISSDGGGTVAISASGVTLPSGSKVEVASGLTKTVALADDVTGTAVRVVPFFTAAGGLVTAAARLNFRSSTRGQAIANFTLANGSTLTTTSEELFTF
tara:strand:+ start:1647 stop:2222 length:576 start_codon:yes stop_codon:yes gene_type:complete